MHLVIFFRQIFPRSSLFIRVSSPIRDDQGIKGATFIFVLLTRFFKALFIVLVLFSFSKWSHLTSQLMLVNTMYIIARDVNEIHFIFATVVFTGSSLRVATYFSFRDHVSHIAIRFLINRIDSNSSGGYTLLIFWRYGVVGYSYGD